MFRGDSISRIQERLRVSSTCEGRSLSDHLFKKIHEIWEAKFLAKSINHPVATQCTTLF